MGMCIKKRTHHARPVASRRARGARRSAQAKVSTSTSRILARHPSSLLPSPNQLRRDRSPFPTSTIRAVPSRRPFHKLGHELSFLLPPFSQALSLRHTTQRSAVCSPPEASSSHNSAPSSRSHPSQNFGPWPEHGSAPCQRPSPKMRPPRSPRRCSSRSETHGSLPISFSSSCSLARRSRWTTISTLRTWRQIV